MLLGFPGLHILYMSLDKSLLEESGHIVADFIWQRLQGLGTQVLAPSLTTLLKTSLLRGCCIEYCTYMHISPLHPMTQGLLWSQDKHTLLMWLISWESWRRLPGGLPSPLFSGIALKTLGWMTVKPKQELQYWGNRIYPLSCRSMQLAAVMEFHLELSVCCWNDGMKTLFWKWMASLMTVFYRGLIHLYSPVDCHLHKGRDIHPFL